MVEDQERQATLGRVSATSDLGELANCDLVIESIVEDLTLKKHLFTELDRICGEGTILATNTSTLPVIEMAMETARPNKVCGIRATNCRDLLDAAAQPMKELEAEPRSVAQQPAADLFNHATTAQRIDCAPKAEEKLAIYISAGSLKGFKRPLRVEQRKNRNRFFMWLGLSLVALWFIWAVVR